MSKRSNDVDILLENNEDNIKEKKYSENYHENKNSEIIDKLNNCKSEIDLLNIKINNYKEVIEKTKEYFILELEANYDKHKQIQLQNENKYNELILLLKNDNKNEILSLNQKIGKHENEINEKNEYIKNLTNRNDELNNTVVEYKKQISSLNEQITKIENQNKVLTDDTNMFKLTIEEKDKEIKTLKDEILILNSTINEQEETIDSFKNGD